LAMVYRQLSLTVISQGVWSLLGMIVSLAAARVLSVEEFGWFTVGATGRLFLLSIAGALLITPMTVIGGGLQVQKAALQSLFDKVNGMLIPVVAVILCMTLVASLLIDVPVWAFGIYAAGGLAVELQRRIIMIEQRLGRDLLGGITNVIGVVGGYAILTLQGFMSAWGAFLVVGMVNLIWVAADKGGGWLRFNGLGSEHWFEFWKIGKWILGNNVAGYLYNQMALFYTLALVGVSGVAILEMGRQLMAVAQVLLLGMASFWQPRLARQVYDDSPVIFVKRVWRISLGQTVLILVVIAIFLVIAPTLLEVVLPDKASSYGSAIEIAWIMGLAMLLQSLWQHVSYASAVLGKPEYGFWGRLAVVGLLLPVGYFLTATDGVNGAAWTRVLGEGAFLFFASIALHNAAKKCPR